MVEHSPPDFSKLSEDAKAALRLTFDRHMEVGEVARELGAPLETIRKRLARARVLLGAPSTKAAARMLAEHEGRLDQPRVYPPLAIPSGAVAGDDQGPAAVPKPVAWWRRPNDLTKAQIHVVIALLVVGLAIGFVLVAGFLQSLTSFWTPVRR